MSDKALLKINLNDEYKIKIEQGRLFEDSIFSEVYKAALKNVIEIVRHYDSHKDSKYDDFNNIIAFTGERGKGKSSSMISFRDALVNKESDSNRSFFERQNDPEQYLKDKSFAEIEIIDPSLFRGGESLFEIILAKMFRKFQNVINETDCKIDQTHKRELIQHFHKTFQNLQIINSDRKDIFKKDSIEALSKLAISSNLKEDFDKLVDYYLQHFDKKNFLIIAIDDFDVNIENAYKMLEDIRQFLIQSKVILLISCKLEQLQEAISIQIENLGIKENMESKANRYIAKLIPFNRRIHLPDVQKLKDIDVELYNEKKLLFSSEKLDFNTSLIKLIFEKNSTLFLENILGTNSILPETIRETQAFIGTFSDKNNLSSIKNYLIDEIYKKNVKIEVFQEFENTPVQWFNLIVFKRLYLLYEHYFKFEDTTRRRINNLERISFSNLRNVISNGDIYYLLLEIEKKSEINDYDTIRFLDYFKAYYTIKLLLFSENVPANLSVTKYGFINLYSDILPKEEGKKSRTIVEFPAKLLEEIENNDDKFFLSQFILYLGVGHRTYRYDDDEDIFVNTYEKAVFSPFAIFHNLFNVDILSKILKYDKETLFIENNLFWFNQSVFIRNLYNPSFVLTIYNNLKRFRNKQIKSTLPPTYLDDICLLFVYGIIYSLGKIEKKYNINGLIIDFVSFPIVQTLIKYFTSVEYKSAIVKELNEKYDILALVKSEYNLSENLIEIINNIFNDPKDISENIILSENARYWLNRILNKISRSTFTSAVYYNELKALDKLEGTNQITQVIKSFKHKINSKNQLIKNTAIIELRSYLKSLL